ncbi:hypothetical protein K4F52_004840 [Lecanicillium sp. MT-2017a]|nr:hypothetical protein K4F52_004840 [Lecanicillium sp. MT-2017a]
MSLYSENAIAAQEPSSLTVQKITDYYVFTIKLAMFNAGIAKTMGVYCDCNYNATWTGTVFTWYSLVGWNIVFPVRFLNEGYGMLPIPTYATDTLSWINQMNGGTESEQKKQTTKMAPGQMLLRNKNGFKQELNDLELRLGIDDALLNMLERGYMSMEINVQQRKSAESLLNCKVTIVPDHAYHCPELNDASKCHL